MMLSDSHMHTNFSTDSDAEPETMIRRAVALGMESICFTDHQDLDYPYEGFVFDTKAYWEKMTALRERYRDRIRIRIGVEIGLQPHLHDAVLEMAERLPFDYVIGSVHLLDRKDPFYRDEIPLSDDAMYRRYFEYTLECLQNTEGYHALGHLDYVVRYGYEKERSYCLQNHMDVIDEILRELVRRNIALEVNTAGWKYGMEYPNPHPALIRRYLELGGSRITIGADAHRPEHIGFGFGKIVSFLRQQGVGEITEFTSGQPAAVALAQRGAV